MEITLKMYLIVLPMVFLAALVDAIAGGGGLISLPAYTLTGLDYNIASGCNKFSAMFGTLMATIRYYRSRKLLLIPGLCASLTALPGAYLGTRIAMMLGTEIMNRFMVFAIPLVGALVLLRRKKDDAARSPIRHMKPVCMLIGLVVGFYDGFFGPGTGTFLIILFTWIAGMDMVSASATAKPVNLASNIASLITRMAAGNVLYGLAIPAMFFSIAGGWIGSKLALNRGARLIRLVMMGVLLLLTIKLALEQLA